MARPADVDAGSRRVCLETEAMTYDSNDLTSHGRALENLFFQQQDRILIERHRELKRMEETRQALAEVSGITNPSVLDRLVKLDIHAEIVASLALVPLVEVAWADGRIQDEERAAVLEASAHHGLTAEHPGRALLERWLAHKPDPKLLEAWTLYVEGLCEALDAGEREGLRADIVDRARRVAAAAGGFLGLTSPISTAEQLMLDRLDSAFRK
jgi:hypothetical protein